MKTPTPAGNVRRLPVMVQPLAAETITGFLGRLATANALTPRDLRLHVTDLAGMSPSHPNLERAATWAERLGGLKPGHFADDARRNAMYVRCQHYAWQPTLCRRCGYNQAARTACLRCARGEQSSVCSRGGAVCNRHQRWHIGGADIDLTPFQEYAQAERCLSGTLWKRGIGLTTGELQLAASLIRYWSIEERAEGRIADRMATIGIDSLDADSVFLVAYPEIVRLTTILTDLSFASYLLSPRFSLAEQVWALEAAVVTVMNGCATPRLHQVAERIVARGKMAVETAFGMRQNASNNRPATLEKSLVASSQRHRSCLLRHLSTVRIQILPYEPGVAAPRNRVLVRRHPLPDVVEV
ncbi:hypothetical protein G3N18_02130 [Microbacterium sp. 2C]|uniref:hypothetical protein n=1 Tax=Microbacterium paulum TaxID=2707006 RepID=UPI0018C2A7AB|nr:hypothetical protein [Microbacterium paulum]MBG0716886.1 hypothetical protein [Microbacterium paulum]